MNKEELILSLSEFRYKLLEFLLQNFSYQGKLCDPSINEESKAIIRQNHIDWISYFKKENARLGYPIDFIDDLQPGKNEAQRKAFMYLLTLLPPSRPDES